MVVVGNECISFIAIIPYMVKQEMEAYHLAP